MNRLDLRVMDASIQDEVRVMGTAVPGKKVSENFLTLKQNGRLKAPERVARLAVFLASNESGTLTGETGTENHFCGLGYVVKWNIGSYDNWDTEYHGIGRYDAVMNERQVPYHGRADHDFFPKEHPALYRKTCVPGDG